MEARGNGGGGDGDGEGGGGAGDIKGTLKEEPSRARIDFRHFARRF